MKHDYLSCIGSRTRSLSRKVDNIYRKYLGSTSVTENQLSILMALYKTGKTQQNKVATLLNLEKSSLSRTLKRIVESGYVEKLGPSNRPIIGLTYQGILKVEEVTPNWEKAMADIQEALGDDGLKAFDQFEELIMNMDQSEDE